MKENKSSFFSEFKKFVMRGNVLDMAVGIVVGGAFTQIVQSVVQDIINPVIGLLIGKIDFKELKVVLVPATESASEVAIRYGALIQNIVQFLLTALVLFVVIRSVNKMREKREEEAKKAAATVEVKEEKESPIEPVVKEETLLLREIRDLLKKEEEEKKENKEVQDYCLGSMG